MQDFRRAAVARSLRLQAVRRLESSRRPPPGSLALASGQPDLDLACRDLGVFFLTDEVDLGGADVGVSGELPHFVHGGAVADGVVDGRLA